MIKKILVACGILLVFSAEAQLDSARYKRYREQSLEEKTPFWDKCYTGGELMLFGGTGQFYLNISPLLGYRPQNKNFSYGVGITYQYTSFIDYYYGSRYSYSLFGLRAFIRQQLGQHFFLHGEYENYFTRGFNVFTNRKEGIVVPCANGFLGYKQNFSEYSYYYIMLGYEFIGDRNTRQYVYYTAPLVLKVGYIFDIKGK